MEWRIRGLPSADPKGPEEVHLVTFPDAPSFERYRSVADLLEWFRKERGYQTRINAIPRVQEGARERQPRIFAALGLLADVHPIAPSPIPDANRLNHLLGQFINRLQLMTR